MSRRVEVPRSARRGSHWIEPKLVGEVAFTEFTREGILRHPSFIALREDKPAREVVLEKPAETVQGQGRQEGRFIAARPVSESRSAARIASSIPATNLTKGDLADYYAAIEALMLVDMAKRPISLVRCPQGRAKQCFFQKHDSGTMGPHVKHVPIKESDGEVAGLSLRPGCTRDPGLRPDGDDRVPRLGQQGEQARISRPAGVRSRSGRGPRLRPGEGGGGKAPRPARRPRPGHLPDADRRQGNSCHRAA